MSSNINFFEYFVYWVNTYFIFRLRDLSAHEKHQTQNLQREIEEKTKQCNDLQKSNEKLTARVEELVSQVNDLHEQVLYVHIENRNDYNFNLIK